DPAFLFWAAPVFWARRRNKVAAKMGPGRLVATCRRELLGRRELRPLELSALKPSELLVPDHSMLPIARILRPTLAVSSCGLEAISLSIRLVQTCSAPRLVVVMLRFPVWEKTCYSVR